MHPHRALTIPDIIQGILEHLSPHPNFRLPDADLDSFHFPCIPDDDGNRSRMLTLSHVSRTCKTFLEPASRILWGVQYGLAPLASVLKNNVSGSIVGVMY